MEAGNGNGNGGGNGDAIRLERVSKRFGDFTAVDDIDLSIPKGEFFSLLGPSGCGKSTILRALNRSNDTVRGFRVEGQIELDGRDIYAPQFDMNELRRRVGIVYQRSNPLPRSVFENVAYELRNLGQVTTRTELQDRVESALKDAALWPEVSDRLNSSAPTSTTSSADITKRVRLAGSVPGSSPWRWSHCTAGRKPIRSTRWRAQVWSPMEATPGRPHSSATMAMGSSVSSQPRMEKQSGRSMTRATSKRGMTSVASASRGTTSMVSRGSGIAS